MSQVYAPNSKVLVADDDPSVLRLVTAIVEAEGLVPIAAADGKDAYRLLRASPGLAGAIIDIRMPYIKGSDLVKFMQSDKRFRTVPVIVMTGDATAQRHGNSLSQGALAVLPKPFTNSQVRTLLRTFIAGSVSR